MRRCIELARLGSGQVAPNPMVGAVLVYDDEIIGEGYHRRYGQAHAEVNCIASVEKANQHLINRSTLYVSLEPCSHFGKTPPCADLIIEKGIPKVVIGCRDPFIEVNGKGMEKLRNARIAVEAGILEKECRELNKRFFCFHEEHRPFVILKWAETGDGKIASSTSTPHRTERLLISNEYTNRIVHKWRSEEMGIMVGTNTAVQDNPSLTTRLAPGKDPVRLVIDMDLTLPPSLDLFDGRVPTIVFNLHRHNLPFEKIAAENLSAIQVGYYQVTGDVSLVPQVMNALYRMNIQSVLVEGGGYLLQSFIDEGLWDEARVISNQGLIIGDGLPAPDLKDARIMSSEKIMDDMICFYSSIRSKEGD